MNKSPLVLHAVIFSKDKYKTKDQVKKEMNHLFPNEKHKTFIRETNQSFRKRVFPKQQFDKTTFVSKRFNKDITAVFGKKHKLTGGELSSDEVQKFVEASYKKKRDAQNIDDYKLDPELSTKRSKVYYDPKTKKAVHTIAGTDSTSDWANNLLIPLGLHKYSDRYKKAENTQKKAIEKYGKDNTALITHSQSGNIAENLTKKGLTGKKDNITLNPAIIGKHDPNLQVVRSDKDIVSSLTKKGNKDIIIKSKGSKYNPLTYITEHSPSILKRTKKMFGGTLKIKSLKGGSINPEIMTYVNTYISIIESGEKPAQLKKQKNKLIESVYKKFIPSEIDDFLKLIKQYNNKNPTIKKPTTPKEKKQVNEEKKEAKKKAKEEAEALKFPKGYEEADKKRFLNAERYIKKLLKNDKFPEIKEDEDYLIKYISDEYSQTPEYKRMSENIIHIILDDGQAKPAKPPPKPKVPKTPKIKEPKAPKKSNKKDNKLKEGINDLLTNISKTNISKNIKPLEIEEGNEILKKIDNIQKEEIKKKKSKLNKDYINLSIELLNKLNEKELYYLHSLITGDIFEYDKTDYIDFINKKVLDKQITINQLVNYIKLIKIIINTPISSLNKIFNKFGFKQKNILTSEKPMYMEFLIKHFDTNNKVSLLISELEPLQRDNIKKSTKDKEAMADEFRNKQLLKKSISVIKDKTIYKDKIAKKNEINNIIEEIKNFKTKEIKKIDVDEVNELIGDIERKLILPKPIDTKESINILINNVEGKLKQIQQIGRTYENKPLKYSSDTEFTLFGYLYLIDKYDLPNILFGLMTRKNEFVVSSYSIELRKSFLFGMEDPFTKKKIYDVDIVNLKNDKEFIKNFFTEIKTFINNGEELIFIPLSLSLGSGGHANMLVYRVNERRIERFEPHGSSSQFKEGPILNDTINDVLINLFEVEGAKYLNKNTPIFSMITPNERDGFQSYEGNAKKHINDGTGYCQLWSLFFMELVALNRNISSNKLVDQSIEIAEASPQYFRDIIRGYVSIIYKEMNEFLKKVKKDFKIDFENPKELKGQRENKDLINYFYKLKEDFKLKPKKEKKEIQKVSKTFLESIEDMKKNELEELYESYDEIIENNAHIGYKGKTLRPRERDELINEQQYIRNLINK